MNKNTITVVDENTFLYKEKGIKIDETTINDIPRLKFGELTKVSWGQFSYGYKSQSVGISFTCRQVDTAKVIEWISIFPRNCVADLMGVLKISKTTTIKDIVEVFGEGEWIYTNDLTELSLDFEFMDVNVAVDSVLLDSELNPLSDLDWDKYFENFKNEVPLSITFY